MASLKGIRVLEMAQIMAGPTCGLLLADLGAEVIKIEKTPGGDDTRNFLPPDVNGVSAAYLMMNRNKKGIALNLKDKKGIEIFKTMIKNSDVVLENFRKGTLEKLGIGYDTMSKINPKIILCEISGYGRTICEGAPKVARWHKEFARNIIKKGKVTEKINNLGYKCYDTEDFKIGYQSFLNKTKPKFKNK